MGPISISTLYSCDNETSVSFSVVSIVTMVIELHDFKWKKEHEHNVNSYSYDVK